MKEHERKFVDVMEEVEPVIEILKARIATDAPRRPLWKAMRHALDLAYVSGLDAPAVLLARSIAAILDGRADEAAAAVEDAASPRLSVYAPSTN